MIYLVVYGVVAFVTIFGANAYPVWREGMGNQMTDGEADNWHFGGSLIGVFWPAVAVLLPVALLARSAIRTIREAIITLAKAEHSRRERVALSEQRAKALADQGRYVIEEGPHR